MKRKYLTLTTLAFLCCEVMAQAAVIGRTYDSQANAYFTLYSSGCRDSRFSGSFPFHWEATSPNGVVLNAPSGQPMVGCYALNQQTSQVMLNANGQVLPLPFSGFAIASNQTPGGGILDFLRAIGDGVGRASNYYNNSAAQTQRNTTNLTPGLTGGNTMNCTPDGRGGYNCR
ncbi:hypothetical protein PKF022_05440 [Polynucleobacter sp. KF022]|nr:hypothetical protein PKF022_05440 [Polynucleobacter sp. KF022]